MILKTIATFIPALCATQLFAQTVPPVQSSENAMAGHSVPGTLVTLDEWTQRMHRVLERELQYPRPFAGYRPGDGTVRVKFNCSDSGRPDKVSLVKTSGDSLLDRAALRAVRRMASLHPLPTGFKPTQKFEALVVFASNPLDPRLAAIDAERTKHNAWYRDPASAMNTPPRGSMVEAQVASN